MIGTQNHIDRCTIIQCFDSKESTEGEYYFAKSGVWASVTTYPILDKNGDIECGVVFFREITGQKKQETQLLLLERALNQSIDGIAVADMDGFNQFVNPAWAQTHGYTVEEMLGANLYPFHTENQLRDNIIPFFQKVMQYGINRGESEHIKKAIETCKWQIEEKAGAASLFDLNPGTLRGRMRKYDIKRN